MDPNTRRKIELLERNGYRYVFDRDIFFNRESRKCFSLEFVEDKSEEELLRLIETPNQTGDWEFYFNAQPSPYLRNELASILAEVA